MFPLDFPFITYLLNSNYEKSAKFNPTFLQDIFFPSSQNIDKSVCTQECWANLASQKKRRQNKSNFWMVNLCNSGTKDFVELWKIIHLNIWTQLTYSITVKPVQKTTYVQLPLLSPPKQIPDQLLLSNMTSNHFSWLTNEKNLSKTITANECKKT